MKKLNGILFSQMINSAVRNLGLHAKEINELNVFPIPDGDTGDNMLLTITGAQNKSLDKCESLSDAAKLISEGMLLSARGNSGVILSQFFEGIKNGFSGLLSADAKELGDAFNQGVKQAYSSVMTPTEGTILTVMREATEYAISKNYELPEDFLNAFIEEARRSLERTPELLPVLKKAGVVDSGGAGLIYIVEGMLFAATGRGIADISDIPQKKEELDFLAFDEDSVLEFGYCTELLIRLQNAKTDIPSFDINVINDYLKTIGDSIVTVQNGSIVKLHVHTMTPGKVLSFCQQCGEFLKVKIENMTLQHNNTVTEEMESAPPKERTKYGVVAVASGDGLKRIFRERGADAIIDGGQSMNPSTEEFIEAFDMANAEVIFVFPNNSNILLTAKQAAHLYEKSDVRVVESKSIGAGYSSLAMLDTSSGDTDAIFDELQNATADVVTAEISHCIRDAEMGDFKVLAGDYIGFVGKELLAASSYRLEAVIGTIDALNFSKYEICILICGKDGTDEEMQKISAYINEHHKGKEFYAINGGQEVYDYIIIVE